MNDLPTAVLLYTRIGQGFTEVERMYFAQQIIKASALLAQGTTENFVIDPETRKTVYLFFNETAFGAATASIAISLQYKDLASGTWVTLHTFTPTANTVEEAVLTIGPWSMPVDANPLFYFNGIVTTQGTFRLSVTCSNNAGDSVTYSIAMLATELG